MRKTLAILFAGAKGTAQSVYWIRAFYIAARHIIEWAGALYWSSAYGGSLFPWPNEPGPFTIILRLNAVDEFIYGLLVSGMFVAVAIIVTAVTGFVGWLAGVYLERVRRRIRGNLKNR